jgi:ribosome-associated protein
MNELLDFDALLAECTYAAVRSGGKGGQNVNKVSSKVILYFSLPDSIVLSDEQKQLINVNLMSRINKEGMLQLSSSVERSQLANKKRVQEKFIQLIVKALEVQAERIETQVPQGSKLRRKEEKKRISEKKQLRGGVSDEEINL